MWKHVRKIMLVTIMCSFVIPSYTVMGMVESPVQSKGQVVMVLQWQAQWQSQLHNETIQDSFKPKVRKKRI
jgi:hypothetical protein